MDPRRLGLILMLGGTATVVLALIWFIAAYADAMDMASSFGGNDYAMKFMACLYSSAAMCQGAAMLSDGPTYSPVVFWIGVIGLLGGIVVRFAASKGAAAGPGGMTGLTAGDSGQGLTSDEILGFVPPAQYARYGYILALSGAVAGLLMTPLALVAFAGFVLALLGLTVYRTRLPELDVQHLGLICLVFVASALLLYIARGTFLFLLAALAQIACFYVGFNSYRNGRIITAQTAKAEALMALQPATRLLSDRERP